MNYTLKKRAGFLMLEMLCALALFALISSVLARAYCVIIRCQERTFKQHYAWSLARTIVEKVRVAEWSLGSRHYEGYDIQVTAAPYQLESVQGFDKLNVIVSWEDKATKQKYTVTVCAGMIHDE